MSQGGQDLVSFRGALPEVYLYDFHTALTMKSMVLHTELTMKTLILHHIRRRSSAQRCVVSDLTKKMPDDAWPQRRSES